ncbi:hypothetical protein Q3G72_033813 [Acer saccharum]|nr:hypothetical protein Q3G72_033813 [Acer saccharum]
MPVLRDVSSQLDLYNFGNSNSDTGGISAAMTEVTPPNGETFFGHPAGRLSDGRLIIDFIGKTPPFKSGLPRPRDFSKALYTFDIGQNDISYGFKHSNEEQVRATIPDILNQFSQAVQAAFTYVDVYAVKYALISNAKNQGFVDPMNFCCGRCMKGAVVIYDK